MKISEKGMDLIKGFEGFRSRPYLCSAGVPTIGYGSTYYENGDKVSLDDSPISEAEAEELFKTTLKKYERSVTNALTVSVFQYEFDALVSLCYNIGCTNFSKSTLVKMLNEGEAPVEIADQFLRWNKAGGKVVNGLTTRREAERLFFLGIEDYQE